MSEKKEYISSQFEGQESDPYPPEFRSDMAQEKCRICNRLFGEHSQVEFEECFAKIMAH